MRRATLSHRNGWRRHLCDTSFRVQSVYGWHGNKAIMRGACEEEQLQINDRCRLLDTASTTHHYSNKSMHKGQCCAERLAYVSRRVALQRRSFRQHETFVASYCIYVKTQHCIKIVQQENLALATARSSIPLLVCTNIFDTNCIVSVIPSPE
eukprot:scaffold6311_cov163-Skeletonema_menzelii.AAC.2